MQALLLVGALTAAYLLTRRNANGGIERGGGDPASRPSRSTPGTDSSTPTPPRSSMRLRPGAVVTARTGIARRGKGKALVYNGLRIDWEDNMQMYLLLKEQGTGGPTIAEHKLSNPPPPYIQEKLTEFMVKEAEKKFAELGEDAKCEAAERLNQAVKDATGSDPGITCDDSVADAINKAAVTAGTAGGVAVCAATGVGTALTPLCGMAGAWLGAYLGPKIGEFFEDVWGGIEDFFSDVWDSKYNPVNWF